MSTPSTVGSFWGLWGGICSSSSSLTYRWLSLGRVFTRHSPCAQVCLQKSPFYGPIELGPTLKMEMLVTQSCVTLCDPMDYSPPGPSLHGISQARILEWVTMPFSRGSSQPGVTLQADSLPSNQIRSVAQSCPTLCDPMNRSTPGLPVHHQLPEFTQTHVQTHVHSLP